MPDGQVVDQSPIINDPYVEPTRHWEFGSEAPVLADGRRPSGYTPAGKEGELSITADVIPLALANDLRDRVRRWREDDYRGATAVTKDLLDRWFDDERSPGERPFFAQREALETIVFLTEAPADRKVGLDIPRTEAYSRWAVKMATGSGKTLVMAMTVTWSVLNKAANLQDARFADAVLVICPNLTVKERLRGLDPHEPVNEYRAFDLVPPSLSGLMGQARVMVTNWHALAPETDPKRSVRRRGPEGDAAFCRRVVEGKLGRKRRLLVLNDEAHHAYRRAPGARVKQRGEEATEAERATVWIDGLARIHRDREILRCVDYSATPMYVPGSGHDPWTPFAWIVSDFALVDAIEAGLVKVPRMPTDDNSGAAVPKYRNLWTHVKASLPRVGDEPDAGNPLTDYLMHVDGPLRQLAGEWQETFERWRNAGRAVPPAMIVVCDSTRMAEVLEAHVGRNGAAGPDLQNPTGTGPAVTVRIDSRLLADAEAREESETATDAAERLRRVVASVGKEGQPGEGVRCLISVAMLSEGWDARNVTQILGLRAFTSQLLCEQVVGRGLRRSSYDNLAEPEYVDVYGVPFQLLPFAKATDGRVIEPPRTTSVVALRGRKDLCIEFPRVVSIVYDVGSQLRIDLDGIPLVVVHPENDPTVTHLRSDLGLGEDTQDHRPIWQSYRRQRFLFEVAARVLAGQPEREALFPQALRAVDWVLDNKVRYAPGVDAGEIDTELYKMLVTNRLRDALRPASHDGGRLLPVLDQYEPVASTTSVAFVTAKPNPEPTVKSHVNYVVCDSELERQIALELEADERVESYVKNDHLHCEIPYRFGGRTLRYLPDFLVRLPGGLMVLIEGKGREGAKDTAKESAARRWVAAVNNEAKWGTWCHAVVRHRSEVRAVLDGALAAVTVVPHR